MGYGISVEGSWTVLGVDTGVTLSDPTSELGLRFGVGIKASDAIMKDRKTTQLISRVICMNISIYCFI